MCSSHCFSLSFASLFSFKNKHKARSDPKKDQSSVSAADLPDGNGVAVPSKLSGSTTVSSPGLSPRASPETLQISPRTSLSSGKTVAVISPQDCGSIGYPGLRVHRPPRFRHFRADQSHIAHKSRFPGFPCHRQSIRLRASCQLQVMRTFGERLISPNISPFRHSMISGSSFCIPPRLTFSLSGIVTCSCSSPFLPVLPPEAHTAGLLAVLVFAPELAFAPDPLAFCHFRRSIERKSESHTCRILSILVSVLV